MGENTGNRKRKRLDSSMETANTTVKAVFKKDDLDDSLSTSDWGLLIEENSKPQKKNAALQLQNEPLSLTCDWDACFDRFVDYSKFSTHLEEHVEDYLSQGEDLRCCWVDCQYEAPTPSMLTQHLCFHGHHAKLKSIGANVAARNDLPPCTQSESFFFRESPEGFRCEWEHCDRAFVTINEFHDHLRLHVFHNPGVGSCCWQGCTTKFPSRYKLGEHLRRHTQEKLLACPTCGNLFSTRTKFCDHRNRQIPINRQSYLCSQCTKYFPSERLLRDHMRLHINHYKCSMCEMTCPKPSVLAKHIRYRHMNEKPFKCGQCKFAFVSKHNLVVHLKTHDPKKQFGCDECDFECRSAYGLDTHVRKEHGKGFPNIYECHNCKKSFKRGSSLTKHLMKVHNFHWPSGHSRFRYKEDPDGIWRLQTVRYETLDVTEEIFKGKSVRTAPNQDKAVKYTIDRCSDGPIEKFVIRRTSPVPEEQIGKPVVITIDDLDAKGNILKSQTIEASEIICTDLEQIARVLDIQITECIMAEGTDHVVVKK